MEQRLSYRYMQAKEACEVCYLCIDLLLLNSTVWFHGCNWNPGSVIQKVVTVARLIIITFFLFHKNQLYIYKVRFLKKKKKYKVRVFMPHHLYIFFQYFLFFKTNILICHKYLISTNYNTYITLILSTKYFI